jgi:hypothetical protein
METYALGGGHLDLADRLHIKKKHSIALGGSANSRIIRTTLKHSYQTTDLTFYVLGMTFLSRNEIPILRDDNEFDGPIQTYCYDEFEGRWTNPQNQQLSRRWQSHWTQKDTEAYVDLKLKSEIHSIEDRLEDLMYRLLSMGTDLINRGHRLIVFQQADNIYQEFLCKKRFDLFRDRSWIIDGYQWRAVTWQHEQGVPLVDYGSTIDVPPDPIKHRLPGCHQKLNQYLVEYIARHGLLI